MKQKIGVEIHKNGSENDVILRMIAHFNDGKVNITAGDVMGYLHARQAIYPTISNYGCYIAHDGEGGKILCISEDGGETLTLTLTWKDIFELEETPSLPLTSTTQAGEGVGVINLKKD